ncbi:unnamed protein product [Cyprideis torosa]|uniref:Uncharacterized protein n=1 Tax=Cyprideis torosa TaxID=163714 RepID=A0A7R8ZN80_9CRUS|nr:unnamed protein product [Cyprideis torosa]CAG0897382.1 unnamed protein product [Cyprideis torosa]
MSEPLTAQQSAVLKREFGHEGLGKSGHESSNAHSIADYLAQLLKDKKTFSAIPNVFHHVERLLDEEISRVRANLFQIDGQKHEPLDLPQEEGPTVALSEKVYVPYKEHPDFNFVGRILGPRGMTAKMMEQETGCKIMVRGKGSMRDKKKEEMNKGKPNWEHLNDELHVLITVEDTENRAKKKIDKAIEEIKKLLIPSADGEDELKKRQLMELAIIKGTYRDSSSSKLNAQQQQAADLSQVLSSLSSADAVGLPRLLNPLTGFPLTSTGQLRQAVPQGLGGAAASLLFNPAAAARLQIPAHLMNGPLLGAADPSAAGLMYPAGAYQDYGNSAANYAAAAAALSQHSGLLEQYQAEQAGKVLQQRRAMEGRAQAHPYSRN